jgi:hypothetical protein
VTVFLPRVQHRRRDVYHSCLSSGKVKNEWIHTSSPPMYLHVWTGKNLLLTRFKKLFCYAFLTNMAKIQDGEL